MKKYIAISLVVVMFAIMACGCAADGGAKNEPVKEEVVITEINPADFPGAKEYDVYYWPKVGIASEIPVPTWSNRGLIAFESEDKYSCYVGYTTIDNFREYVNDIQELGFTENYQAVSGQVYYGETVDGCAILLIYSKDGSFMTIGVCEDYTELGIRLPDETEESN